MKQWSPLHIKILLHYHSIAEPWPSETETLTDYIKELCVFDLLKEDQTKSGYSTTARGNAYIDAILSMPLPIQRWEIPKGEE